VRQIQCQFILKGIGHPSLTHL